MRPLIRPDGESWTSVFPIKNRASLTVFTGNSERRKQRI
jgi:hypothetical protein